jgi:hypothetical protein
LKLFIDPKGGTNDGNIFFRVIYLCEKKYNLPKNEAEYYVWTIVSFDLNELLS